MLAKFSPACLQGRATVEMDTSNIQRCSSVFKSAEPLIRMSNPPCAMSNSGVQGRATVEMDIKFTDGRENNATGGKMTMVLDGYNAPVRWVSVFF